MGLFGGGGSVGSYAGGLLTGGASIAYDEARNNGTIRTWQDMFGSGKLGASNETNVFDTSGVRNKLQQSFGQYESISNLYRSMADQTSGAYAQLTNALTNQLDTQKRQNLSLVSSNMARQGLAGSSLEQAALQNASQSIDQQKASMLAQMGIQSIQGRESLLGSSLNALTSGLQTSYIAPASIGVAASTAQANVNAGQSSGFLGNILGGF